MTHSKSFCITLNLIYLSLGLVGCENQNKKIGEPIIHAVGIETNIMQYHATEQHSTNWCWAASAQMALSTQGLMLPQEQIVRTLFGRLIDVPGGVPQFLQLRGKYKTNRGVFSVSCVHKKGPPSFKTLINNLKSNRPVILALSNPGLDIGHAVIATAVIYQDASEESQIIKVIVRDPSPGQNKRELSATDFSSVMYHVIYHVNM